VATLVFPKAGLKLSSFIYDCTTPSQQFHPTGMTVLHFLADKPYPYNPDSLRNEIRRCSSKMNSSMVSHYKYSTANAVV
jgi:hypothetical protein